MKNPWQRLWEDPVARIGLIVLSVLYLCALFADFMAPYSMYFSDPNLANAPPSTVYFNQGQLYVHPVKRTFDPASMSQSYTEDTTVKCPIKFLCKGSDYTILNLIPGNIHLFGVDDPGRLFLTGSDVNGRDNYSRLLFGAQKSLTIGFLGLLIAFPIGIIYGAISGFVGGWIDMVMMRIAEAVMSVPSFYLLIGLAAVLPAGMSSSERFALITVILSLIGWAGLARVIRGMVLSLGREEFVLAARAAGMREMKNIVVHVIPQTASFLIVAATLQVPSFILSESGLSFIGLGIQQPDASWGNMLKAALDSAADLPNEPWLLAPGFLIFITIACFNTVGDTLRDVLDPKTTG
jgi:peptide/nickel transport system permease protein